MCFLLRGRPDTKSTRGCDTRPIPQVSVGLSVRQRPPDSSMPNRAFRPWTGATPHSRCPVRASRRVGMCTSRTPPPRGSLPVQQSLAGRPSASCKGTCSRTCRLGLWPPPFRASGQGTPLASLRQRASQSVLGSRRKARAIAEPSLAGPASALAHGFPVCPEVDLLPAIESRDDMKRHPARVRRSAAPGRALNARSADLALARKRQVPPLEEVQGSEQ